MASSASASNEIFNMPPLHHTSESWAKKTAMLSRAWYIWMQLMVSVMKEVDWYVAQCLQVDVASQGESIEQALAKLQEAIELLFEGEEAPEIRELSMLAPINVKLSA
jgi:predicted RNase H-like HicB family nuclease